MTVVLITRNLINQFKCLITPALVRTVQKGCCLNMDKTARRRRKMSQLHLWNDSDRAVQGLRAGLHGFQELAVSLGLAVMVNYTQNNLLKPPLSLTKRTLPCKTNFLSLICHQTVKSKSIGHQTNGDPQCAALCCSSSSWGHCLLLSHEQKHEAAHEQHEHNTASPKAPLEMWEKCWLFSAQLHSFSSPALDERAPGSRSFLNLISAASPPPPGVRWWMRTWNK